MAKKKEKKAKAKPKPKKKKKPSKAETPLKDRDDIETPKKEARATWDEIVAAESDQSWIDELASEEVSRYPRIYTGFADIDMLFAPAVGSRIEINGDAHMGKSTLCYVMMGTLLRTCRRCLTFAAEFIDDETGEIIETCRCGVNDFMEGALVDVERAADAVWLDVHGCRTGSKFDVRTHSTGAFDMLLSKNKRLHILRPVSGGPMYTFLQKAIDKGAIDFCFIDSVNSLISDEAIEKPASGRGSVGDRARMNWDGLRRIIAAQNRHYQRFGGLATVVWTNHMIANIGAKWEKETEAGGRGLKIEADQKVRFLFSKTNEGKKDLPFHAYRDTYFRVTKNRAGIVGGGEGSFRMYLNDVDHNKIRYYPGETDDPDRMYSILKDLGLFDKRKGKYLVLGRSFKKVQEVKNFLAREDIGLELRFWLGVFRMPTIARAHLNPAHYLYSPFESSRRFYEETAKQIEKRIPGLCLSAALTDGGPVEERRGTQAPRKGSRAQVPEGLDGVFDEE